MDKLTCAMDRLRTYAAKVSVRLKPRHLAAATAVFFALFLFAGALWALGPAAFPKGPVEFETYKHDPTAIKPGDVATYDFKWNHLDAARATITYTADPNREGWICARGDGEIVGPVSKLYHAKDSLSACMQKDTLKPDLYQVTIRESLDYYDMAVKFDHTAGVVNRAKKTKTKTSDSHWELKNGYCPVSLYTLIRSLPWKVGDERKFEVVDGNSRFLLVVKAAAEETITVKAGTFKALRMEPSLFRMPSKVRKETPEYWQKLEDTEKKKGTLIKSFTLWMAQDPPRHFLKATADVYFGHVDLELSSFKSGG